MSECPTCGDKFDTSGGMKRHHYYSHGESIAKEETNCNGCGCKFQYYPSDKKGLYCSNCVKTTQYRTVPKQKSGKQHPRYSRRTVKCENCESPISRTESERNLYNKNFCDRNCYGEWRSKTQTGSDNPNYIDGCSKGELYKGSWSKNRKIALKRDNYRCQVCGKSKAEIGRNPDVHHIIPIRTFENLEKGHRTENLICLCPECHYEVERDWSNGKTEAFHQG